MKILSPTTIELVVSVVLVALPWMVGISADTRARALYVGAGIVIFFTWLPSDDASSPMPEKQKSAP